MLIKTGSEEKRNNSNKKMFEYKCDCGDIRYYVETVVKNGRVKCCPECSVKKSSNDRIIDMVGKQFNSWTVLSKCDNSGRKSREAIYNCRCTCGEVHEVSGVSMRNGKSKMCLKCSRGKSANNRSVFKDGALANEHRIYRIWKSMKQRCYGSHNNINYSDKGVYVCERWKNNFKSFYEWSISNGYTDKLDLDKDLICDEQRISPKYYSPETCVWITKADNARYSQIKDLVIKEKLRDALLQQR